MGRLSVLSPRQIAGGLKLPYGRHPSRVIAKTESYGNENPSRESASGALSTRCGASQQSANIGSASANAFRDVTLNEAIGDVVFLTSGKLCLVPIY